MVEMRRKFAHSVKKIYLKLSKLRRTMKISMISYSNEYHFRVGKTESKFHDIR